MVISKHLSVNQNKQTAHEAQNGAQSMCNRREEGHMQHTLSYTKGCDLEEDSSTTSVSEETHTAGLEPSPSFAGRTRQKTWKSAANVNKVHDGRNTGGTCKF
jgi:hypothetical protein